MDNRIKIGIVAFFLICSGFAMYSYDNADDGVKILNDDDYKEIVIGGNMEEIYQGPVPQGFDLEHFRKTGETIKEDSK